MNITLPKIQFTLTACVLIAANIIAAPISEINTNATIETNMSFYFCSWQQPAALLTNGLPLITNGITLGRIVQVLGVGWMPPNEGVGIITWFFDDGSQLKVWPKLYLGSEIITTNGTGGWMWQMHGPPDQRLKLTDRITIPSLAELLKTLSFSQELFLEEQKKAAH